MLIDVDYLMSVGYDSDVYWAIQREARDWIRLGVYKRMWPDAKKLPEGARRLQLIAMRELAATTQPKSRCGCEKPGWTGVRHEFWAHWPSCRLYRELHHGDRDGEGANPWLLPINE